MADEHPQQHPREIQWSLADMVDAADLHPLIAGLMLELPWHAPGEIDDDRRLRGGMKPTWYESRRDTWVRTMLHALDLLYDVRPDPERGNDGGDAG